ncbi:hypothetical protein [Paenibacillus sp. MBLB4367]|uniref:hypothetical protein n=1 Tax=Paenibacillus sp. MBLB4367 TaxID=3384767 RepID=UPI003908455A
MAREKEIWQDFAVVIVTFIVAVLIYLVYPGNGDDDAQQQSDNSGKSPNTS